MLVDFFNGTVWNYSKGNILFFIMNWIDFKINMQIFIIL